MVKYVAWIKLGTQEIPLSQHNTIKEARKEAMGYLIANATSLEDSYLVDQALTDPVYEYARGKVVEVKTLHEIVKRWAKERGVRLYKYPYGVTRR